MYDYLVKLRITAAHKVLAEVHITQTPDGLDVSSQLRTGSVVQAVVLDALVASLWQYVPEDDIRQRALIMSLMHARGMARVEDRPDDPFKPNPKDDDPADSIPF